MKRLLILVLLMAAPVFAAEKASEDRLDAVERRGLKVMPFDLNLTSHVFSKTVNGGVQQVVVKDPNDSKQISLIREHLNKIYHQFKQGDFSDPGKIHGESMPGLATLRQAKPGQIRMVYTELPDGAQIDYSTDSPVFIQAIHQWFNAQLSDHARHAVSGRSMHQMHHQ